MDPFAHTFTGGALAASGLRRATPLATAALLLGANAPDIDILISYAGDYMSLAHRRGWTHGLLAWLILPLLLTGLLTGWDRWVRRRRRAAAPPARFWPLLGLSLLGVLSHPALDWLNNYGIRLLMPFDGRWFYGDALFIVDPWVWLALGGVVFLAWSPNRASLLGWGLFWGLASWLVLGHELTPPLARYLWIAGLAAVLAWRALRPGLFRLETAAKVALALTFIYMGASALASLAAEKRTEVILASRGYGPVDDVMVGPVPGNPFRGSVVVSRGDHYLLANWRWLAPDPLQLKTGAVPHHLDHPAARAAANHLYARRYLTWSRFPYAEIRPAEQGYRVRFGDARYGGFGAGIGGPTIALDRAFNLLPAH